MEKPLLGTRSIPSPKMQGLKKAQDLLWNQEKRNAMKLVASDGYKLKHVSIELQKDKDVALCAVRSNGLALQFAAEELQSDRQVVLAAVKQNSCAYLYASHFQQTSWEVATAAIHSEAYSPPGKDAPAERTTTSGLSRDQKDAIDKLRNGLSLNSLPSSLRGDKHVVMAAVQKNGLALRFATLELRNDRDVAMAAVKENGFAMQFACEFQKDKDLVLEAVQSKGIERLTATLLLEEDCVDWSQVAKVREVRENGGMSSSDFAALQFASSALKGDREVVLAAVQSYGEALQFASRELKNDKELVLAAVKQSGNALKFASRSLQADKEVVMAAVQHPKHTFRISMSRTQVIISDDRSPCGYLFTEASKSGQDLLTTAINPSHSDLYYSRLGGGYAEVVLSSYVAHAEPSLRRDKDVMLASVQHDGDSIWFASEELQCDTDVLLEAVTQAGIPLLYNLPDEVCHNLPHEVSLLGEAFAQLMCSKEYDLDLALREASYLIENGCEYYELVGLLVALRRACLKANDDTSGINKVQVCFFHQIYQYIHSRIQNSKFVENWHTSAIETLRSISGYALAEVIYLRYSELVEVALQICDLLTLPEVHECSRPLGDDRSVILFLDACAKKKISELHPEEVKIKQLLLSRFPAVDQESRREQKQATDEKTNQKEIDDEDSDSEMDLDFDFGIIPNPKKAKRQKIERDNMGDLQNDGS